MLKLSRISSDPILVPNPDHKWEAAAVFNCGAIYHDGQVHLIYRATNITSNGKQGKYINSFGYAVSENGIDFLRFKRPILTNDTPQELRGPEDPRIVRIMTHFIWCTQAMVDGLMMTTGYALQRPKT